MMFAENDSVLYRVTQRLFALCEGDTEVVNGDGEFNPGGRAVPFEVELEMVGRHPS